MCRMIREIIEIIAVVSRSWKYVWMNRLSCVNGMTGDPGGYMPIMTGHQKRGYVQNGVPFDRWVLGAGRTEVSRRQEKQENMAGPGDIVRRTITEQVKYVPYKRGEYICQKGL